MCSENFRIYMKILVRPGCHFGAVLAGLLERVRVKEKLRKTNYMKARFSLQESLQALSNTVFGNVTASRLSMAKPAGECSVYTRQLLSVTYNNSRR